MSRWGLNSEERRGYEDREKANRWASYPYSESYDYRQGWDEQARDERREEQRRHEAHLENQRQEEQQYQQYLEEQERENQPCSQPEDPTP